MVKRFVVGHINSANFEVDMPYHRPIRPNWVGGGARRTSRASMARNIDRCVIKHALDFGALCGANLVT